MSEPVPPSKDGYLWVARVALPSPKVHVLSRELRGFRHELRARDVSGLGDSDSDLDVDLWAHPADQGAVARILGRLVAE